MQTFTVLHNYSLQVTPYKGGVLHGFASSPVTVIPDSLPLEAYAIVPLSPGQGLSCLRRDTWGRLREYKWDFEEMVGATPIPAQCFLHDQPGSWVVAVGGNLKL